MPTSAPRTSIVIPAYNRAHVLARTIDSVLAQCDPNWEMIVSDDGSTDETLAVAHAYADQDERISVITSANGGVARARNRGYASTDDRSEFVVFLDSDDRWFASTLTTMVAALEAHPEWVSVYGLARCIDGDDQLIPGDDLQERMRERLAYRGSRLVELDVDEPTTFASMVHHNYPATPGLHLMRRSVLDVVGEFDPAVDPADDWDLAIRLTTVGPIGFVDELVLEWRRHGDTLTETSPRWRKAYYGVLEKSLSAPDATAEQRRLVRLAYRALAIGNLRAAATDLGRRRVGPAFRGAVRSVDAVAQLTVTEARRGWRRVRSAGAS